MREMKELAPIVYTDAERGICIECFADTLVYQKEGSKERKIAAIRIGGYPESVRGMIDAMRAKISMEAEIDGHTIILSTVHSKCRTQITHDGVYAEGTLMAADDEIGTNSGISEEAQKKLPRRSYIFCEEDNPDALFSEIDKKTSIPMIPEFRDYVIFELLARKILIPLEVLSASAKFDAYVLNMRGDEKDVEKVINDGIKSGKISIPKAVPGGFGKISSVAQYLREYGVTIANRIRNIFNPLFDPAKEDICERIKLINRNIKKNVGYSLYPAQLAVAESLKRRLDRAKTGIVIAECGAGKTKIGAVALAAHQKGRKCLNIVLSPSHVTKKWVREIEETLPNTKAAVVYSINDINRVYKDFKNGSKSVYMVMSKERARDGYMRRPAVIYSKLRQGFLCPHCFSVIEEELTDDGTKYMVNASQFFFRRENRQNHKCPNCKESLWTVINPEDCNPRHNLWVKIGNYGFVYRPHAQMHQTVTKDLRVLDKLKGIMASSGYIPTTGAYRRYSMSSYIAENIRIDGVIADELHLFKGDSGQGNAMATLIGCAKKVIGMTATLINGYSSGMFYLLYRISSHLMIADNKPYDKPEFFNNEYGVTETVYQLSDEGEYNANSRNSKKKALRTKQKPGVSPLVYSRFLIDSAVFLSLNDMGKELPEYEEIPVALNMREDIAKEYERIEGEYIKVMRSWGKNPMRLMSKFMSLLTTYPDQPYANAPIMYPGSGEPVVVPKDLSDISELHEKDIAVLDIVRRKVENGDKVLIYTSWVGIDTQEKLTNIMTENGYKSAVLKNTVSPDKREEWVANRLSEGIDVLITNGSLVETGLDLNAFTTIIYYNIGYNLYTFRQSSRRSWRINQTAPRVEVYILYYKGVLQERAIKLMAAKLAAATLVEGNFTEEGLASMSNCEDMTSQLARTLTNGIRDEVDDLSEAFKKMAIVKDTPDDAAIIETRILSIHEKLMRARELAKQARGEQHRDVVYAELKSYKDCQVSLFDMAS